MTCDGFDVKVEKDEKCGQVLWNDELLFAVFLGGFIIKLFVFTWIGFNEAELDKL